MMLTALPCPGGVGVGWGRGAASRQPPLDTARACAVGRLEGPALLQQLQKHRPQRRRLGRAARRRPLWRRRSTPLPAAALLLLLVFSLCRCSSLICSSLLLSQQVDEPLPGRQVGGKAPEALRRRLAGACPHRCCTLDIQLNTL